MIKINNLLFNYRRKTKVFTNLNLEIETGGVIGLLGRNGAGKTTLLKLMSGMLIPQAGKIDIIGYSPAKRQPDLLQKIFLIPEEIYSPAFSIRKFFELYSPFYPDFDKDKFLKILDTFELTLNQKIIELSYGQKKRIWFAFALATGCKIIFMDEPTNGLDIPSKKIFRQLITAELSEDKLFIISSHQIRDIDSILDTLIIIEHGTIKLHETLAEISAKYIIGTSVNEPKGDVLYKEKLIDGYRYLELNSSNTESKIDLEFLFNAVTDNRMNFETNYETENEKVS